MRRWTAIEDDRLVSLYRRGVPVAEIARELERSVDAVVARRRLRGIASRRSPRRWSQLEDTFMRSATESRVPATVLAERLNRSPEQVRRRRRQLGLARAAARPYDAKEDAALCAQWSSGRGLQALAEELGRSPDALRLRAQQLHIHRPPPRRRWTSAEDAVVRDGYADGLACSEIARALRRRTPAAVAARARKLGLTTYARLWTAADDTRLRRLLAVRSPADAAPVLGRTPEAVRRRARSLAVTPTLSPAPRRAGARWTEAEDELLALHAGLNPATLSVVLGRSDGGVVRRLALLGLRSGRERSPHHPAPRNGEFTPAERTLIERELRSATPSTLLALARRLERSPAAIRQLARATQVDASALSKTAAP